jgi:hypothetical protein
MKDCTGSPFTLHGHRSGGAGNTSPREHAWVPPRDSSPAAGNQPLCHTAARCLTRVAPWRAPWRMRGGPEAEEVIFLLTYQMITGWWSSAALHASRHTEPTRVRDRSRGPASCVRAGYVRRCSGQIPRVQHASGSSRRRRLTVPCAPPGIPAWHSARSDGHGRARGESAPGGGARGWSSLNQARRRGSYLGVGVPSPRPPRGGPPEAIGVARDARESGRLARHLERRDAVAARKARGSGVNQQ